MWDRFSSVKRSNNVKLPLYIIIIFIIILTVKFLYTKRIRWFHSADNSGFGIKIQKLKTGRRVPGLPLISCDTVITLRIALTIPSVIGSEVFITYIGLGLPVTIPSLGRLIEDGRPLLATNNSYQLFFPVVVLSIITISFYIIGSAFSDSADPKNHRWGGRVWKKK